MTRVDRLFRPFSCLLSFDGLFFIFSYRFTHFRVPKTSLLCKYIEVSETGQVTKKGNPRALYSGMMFSRFGIILNSTNGYFRALTIAFRYSLLRKQFKDAEGNEIPIYRYQLQREKLFSELAKAYALTCFSFYTRQVITENFERSKKNDFSLLQTAHLLLSGSKAMSTWWWTQGMTKLIQACGGHGYHMYSGIPDMFRVGFADTILEGENSVLLLQLSRAQVKAFQVATKGDVDKVPELFDYLKDLKGLSELSLEASDEVLQDLDSLLNVFRKTLAYHVKDVSLQIRELVKKGNDPKAVRNDLFSDYLTRLGLGLSRGLQALQDR